MDVSDVLDLQRWIDPLEQVQAQIREHRIAMEATHREWLAGATDEIRSKVDLIRSLIPAMNEVDSERDNPQLSPIVSPLTLGYVEQYRAQQKIAERGWETTPVDVFVWALGDAPQRTFTKVGGDPYRRADLPWPKIQPATDPYPVNEGATMTFLAQFNFAGSRDLFPQLPGDLLLIFAEDETFSRPEGVYCEWQSLDIPEEELIPPKEVPTPAWDFVTCHGFRHRTVDYRGKASNDSQSTVAKVATMDATKIGGYPNLLQTTNEEFDGRLHDTGTIFLAQLRSIFPHSDEYYPWMNHYEPMTLDRQDQYLSLVDDGTLYFRLNPQGEVTWEFECG